MSTIYIQEPPTNGKVLLTTSVGEIDVELWSKEAPKACRNFVQLCMEGYYDDTVFHRVVKDFIVQGGDPTGTGEGGESIYGGPFKDEFHSRLRFVRRGLVAMANIGPHTNGSQFFFTMGLAPKLQNKHTIFGKVTGQTVYNMIRLQEIETDENDRPDEPHKIIKTEILSNPFEDIIPRPNMKKQKKVKEEKKKKNNSKATNLLSFGEEAEEDEERTFKASKKFSGKSKSSHDLIDDPNLSSVPVTNKADKKQGDEMEEVSERLGDEKGEMQKIESAPAKDVVEEIISVEDEKKKKREETKKEAKRLQKELKAAKLREKTLALASSEKTDVDGKGDEKEASHESGEPDFLEKFKLERQKFKDLQKMQKKKGGDREAQTMAMLSKFQSKLSNVQKLASEYSDSEEEEEKQEDEENNDDNDNLSWMSHKLIFEEDKKRKVLDANIEDSDRYEIHDPRNPITQRRREASRKKPKTSSK